MKHAMILLALTLATPLSAQSPMTAAEFDAYTQGKTLFYAQNGQTYGAERYMDNRRVEWSFLDGQCKPGSWFERDGQICFTYDDTPTPQCWSFRKGNDGLIAQFENEPSTTQLYEAQDSNQDFTCLGPEIGV